MADYATYRGITLDGTSDGCRAALTGVGPADSVPQLLELQVGILLDPRLTPEAVAAARVALLNGTVYGATAEPNDRTGGNAARADTGAVTAWASVRLETASIFVATVAAVALLVAAGYLVQARSSSEAQGLTTEIAAVTVCLLGGVCLLGSPGQAVALGIATSALLAYKQPLHSVVAKLGTDDLYAGLKLLVATFIVLPLLPNRTVDPWGALNPYALWWLVILISALSLVGSWP